MATGVNPGLNDLPPRPLSGPSNGSRWRMSSLKFFVEWPNNVRVQPNDTISKGLSVERPRLVWGAESNALYIIMFFGGWSDRVLPKGTAMLWVVTNIPGNSVKDGNKVIESLTPYNMPCHSTKGGWNPGKEHPCIKPSPLLPGTIYRHF